MAHDNHIIDGKNKELDEFGRDWFFNVTKNWIDPYGLPTVIEHEGIKVVRDDMIVGSKCRFADLLMQSVTQDTIVYVQPRAGLAGVSILEVAKKYNKKVILFMPSSKKISYHQAVCIERGAIPKFRRIAAMPVLNKYAKDWAKENNAFFIPLGLKHELVIACAARVAQNLVNVYGEPETMFVATSTGVLVRGLQIAMPNTEFKSICVARNMKSGELGKSIPLSDPLPFLKNEKFSNLPPFPTVPNYDGKVWKYIPKYSNKNIWMWNVGKEPELKDETIYNKIDSQREWGEFRD